MASHKPDPLRYTPIPAPLLGGKYEAVEPIGRGGMASVWLGYTHGVAGFRRKVAIKRVLTQLSEDERFEAMFVEEARVVAELNHPNVVQVHDFGRDHDGGYYIVMEWVEGVNLADYVRGYQTVNEIPPWYLSCAICIEVLRALSSAHLRIDEAGRPVPVIHRDVTPSNIMVGINGAVKLTDFGLARAMDRPRTTDPGTVKGKVAYLAPELLENAKPDPRCDLYSVGVVLWEMLTAQRLFGGERTDVEVALRILEGKIPKVAELRPDVPQELSDLVEHALQKSPRDRYQRAQDMIEALSQLLRRQSSPTDGAALARSAKVVRKLLARVTGP
jgi:serine/threonine-protein kinase